MGRAAPGTKCLMDAQFDVARVVSKNDGFGNTSTCPRGATCPMEGFEFRRRSLPKTALKSGANPSVNGGFQPFPWQERVALRTFEHFPLPTFYLIG
jgi:hypothetical protein